MQICEELQEIIEPADTTVTASQFAPHPLWNFTFCHWFPLSKNAALVKSFNFSFLIMIVGISVGDSYLASTTFLDWNYWILRSEKRKKKRKCQVKWMMVIIFHLIREPNSHLIRTKKPLKREHLMGRPRGKHRTCWRHVPRPVQWTIAENNDVTNERIVLQAVNRTKN